MKRNKNAFALQRGKTCQISSGGLRENNKQNLCQTQKFFTNY